MLLMLFFLTKDVKLLNNMQLVVLRMRVRVSSVTQLMFN